MGGGAQQLQCKSESAKKSNGQINSRALVRGIGGGGLKFEKKLDKHSPQPNNIGPARQQPRALF